MSESPLLDHVGGSVDEIGRSASRTDEPDLQRHANRSLSRMPFCECERRTYKAARGHQIMKSIRSPQEIRNGIFAASCSPSEAAAWLRDRTADYSTVYGTKRTRGEDHLPEYIFFRRAEPAIDLALAEHGRSRTVLRKLYDRAHSGLRAVLCSNASLFVGDDHRQRISFKDRSRRHLLWEIVENGSLAQLRALCANPGMTSGFYSALVKIWPGEDGNAPVYEDRFRMLVEFLSDNPRVSQSREESRERHYLDGVGDYQYNQFYIEAWNLALRVPPTPEWAGTLAKLFHRLHRPFKCLKDIPAVLLRWTPENEDAYGPYWQLREAICRAFVEPTLEELTHPDPAHRSAFIETFDPEAREFRDLDWQDLAAADPNWYLSASGNMKIWASPSAREKFRNQLWADSQRDSDIVQIGFLNEREEELRKTHPEWFVEPEVVEDAAPRQPDRIDLLRIDIRNAIQTMSTARHSRLVSGGLFLAGLIVGGLLL
jgi:hypothetical protein